MATATLNVPEDLVVQLSSGGRDPARILQLAAAFFLCNRGELTVRRGARLAGLTYQEFLQASVRYKVEIFPIDLEELKEEIEQGFTMGRRHPTDDPPGLIG
jgi:hypothetical protein